MNIFSSLISLLLIILPFAPARETEEYIDWGQDRKLSWNDFEGSVDQTSDAAASTSTFLGFNYRTHGNEFTYKIECKFSKKNSWGLVKNQWILNHEQGHFDISEIFARELYMEIAAYKPSMKTMKKDLDVIYRKKMKEKEEFQMLYDTETNFSRNKSRQRDWLEHIDKILEETKDFADYNNPPKKFFSK